MEDWLDMVRLERGMRNSFLVNRKPTESEIGRMKDFFKQMEDTKRAVERLTSELRVSQHRRHAKDRIRREIIRFCLLYESLEELVMEVDCLDSQFMFDLGQISNTVEAAIRDTLN